MDAWVVSAITGGVAIASGWLGTFWGRQTEHRQWFRNARQESYSDFLDDTGIGDVETVLNGDVIKSSAVAKQRAALHRLQLLAPDRICELAIRAVESAKELARANRDGADSKSIQVLKQRYAASTTILSYGMRLDLHRTNWATRKKYKKLLAETK